MACEVRFQTSRSERMLQVPTGTSLLDAAVEEGLPLARACAGRSLCGRCGLRVHQGTGALSPEQPEEREAKRRNRVDADQRLACCAEVRGDVTVSAGYW